MDCGDLLAQSSIKRPRYIHHKELGYIVHFELGFLMRVKTIKSISTGSAVGRRQTDTFNGNVAPNCDWSTWKELVATKEITEEHNYDVNCFLGNIVEPNIPDIEI